MWVCGFGFVKVIYVLYLNKLSTLKVYSIKRVKYRAQRRGGI